MLSRFIFDISFDLISSLIWALFTHASAVVLETHNPHKINIKIHILSFDFLNENRSLELTYTNRLSNPNCLYFALWHVSVFLHSPGVPAVYLSLFLPLSCENQAMPLRLSYNCDLFYTNRSSNQNQMSEWCQSCGTRCSTSGLVRPGSCPDPIPPLFPSSLLSVLHCPI